MNKLSKLGYYNVAAISPEVFIGDPEKNMNEMIRLVHENKDKAQILVFPELSLTGYTCEDLFLKEDMYKKIQKSLKKIKEIQKYNNLVVFGLPIFFEDRLYNTGVFCYKGKIIGVVPKYYLPEYNEFYEKRWFTSGEEFHNKYPEGTKIKDSFIELKDVHFGINQIIKYGKLKISMEICEDIWSPLPPSTFHSIEGAHLNLNLSASPELVGKNSLRKKLCDAHSERTLSAYLYVSSGYMESTKDVVFGGHSFSYEMGTFLGESDRFSRETKSMYTIDLERIQNHRRRNKTYGSSLSSKKYNYFSIDEISKIEEIYRKYKKHPFLPAGKADSRVEDIIKIQTKGLSRRLESIGHDTKIVLGLSGGLDSTLALLVALESTAPRNIIAISMPGPGTSKRTRDNAKKLAKKSGVNFQEIDINSEVELHLKNIKHNNETDVTYENVQARIRTLHLFNLANKYGGIVLGTGDLSEIALGWCTYNGDHMSSYNVNASIPKTLVKYLVEYFYKDDNLKSILKSIVDTKISPELKKNSGSEIIQATESIIGPYELHDLFLYHYIKNSHSDAKIMYIAERLYEKEYDVKKWYQLFKTRFKQNQFKRTVMTAGPKVGTVSLSPRGDWRMPDEN